MGQSCSPGGPPGSAAPSGALTNKPGSFSALPATQRCSQHTGKTTAVAFISAEGEHLLLCCCCSCSPVLGELPCCGGGGGTVHLPHAFKSQREWWQHSCCATSEPATSLPGISAAIGRELLLPRLLSLGCPRGSAQPRCYLCAAAPAGIPRHPDKNKHLNVKAAAWGFVAMLGRMSPSTDKNSTAANLERALRRRRQQNKPRASAHSDTGQPCPASIPSARFSFCVPSRGASQLRPQHITLLSLAACFSAGCTQLSIKTPPQPQQWRLAPLFRR